MRDLEAERKVSRRGFLRRAGFSIGAAGVVTTALMQPTAVSSAAAPATERRKAGYRETEHVRRAYDLARF